MFTAVWRALLDLVIVVAGLTGIILAMMRWAPGVNPGFVLVPLTVGLVAVAWQREGRPERPSQDSDADSTAALPATF